MRQGSVEELNIERSMANINLGKYYKKSTDTVSLVDSRITLNKSETNTRLYGDIKLDLEFEETKNRSLHAGITDRDLQLIYNEESVLTSLKNIFKTFKGSRILNPDMEFDLSQYLFEPLTRAKAFFLGYDLMSLIPRYEPRVVVNNVDVTAHPQDGCYRINLSVTLKDFNKDIDMKCIFDEDSFSILP